MSHHLAPGYSDAVHRGKVSYCAQGPARHVRPMRPAAKPRHSWHDDPNVPAFNETRILLVMDGDCGLCSSAAARIARMDRNDRIRITVAGAPLGRALLHHFDLEPDDPRSWLMIEEGRAFGSLDGMIRLFPRLSPWGHLLRPLGWLPFAVQDWLYARIARNRYAIWGRGDLCALPDAALRARLVD